MNEADIFLEVVDAKKGDKDGRSGDPCDIEQRDRIGPSAQGEENAGDSKTGDAEDEDPVAFSRRPKFG